MISTRKEKEAPDRNERLDFRKSINTKTAKTKAINKINTTRIVASQTPLNINCVDFGKTPHREGPVCR